MKEVIINKGWYLTAGWKYGWGKKGLDPKGVGIAKEYLINNQELVVVVDGIRYHLYTTAAIQAIKDYNSKMRMAGGTIIGVVPKSLLEEIK